MKKVLIANRGEIACRIIQTLQEMGIQTVAIYSDVDADANHVLLADEAYPLAGVKTGDTYLNVDKILIIAKNANVDGVHPGYGFLSENAGFATACAKAKITFIGPSPEVIDAMGDKLIAKSTVEKAGVPTVPGWTGDMTTPLQTIQKEANRIGYPLLVKAAAGGGGKGMRRVEEADGLQDALEAAQREAKNAFGDSRVFLEKYITRPRHIEFQIFGDQHGNVVHLFERDCSIQRRYQKVIEESPAFGLSPKLREKMGQAAVAAAKAINYTNAGTVEFIVTPEDDFYFLEVNTRLQVEHPVTEMVTHLDLVRLQIDIADGKPLPFKQADLKQIGHAIECRIYAEDPSRNFMPATGKLQVYELPTGPNIRVDNGYREGYNVSVHYDPMLAKLIVWAESREAAIAKMRWALSHYIVLGLTHNIDFLRQIIEHPAFAKGDLHTHFLTDHPITPEPNDLDPEILTSLVANLKRTPTSIQTHEVGESPWQLLGAWRGGY